MILKTWDRLNAWLPREGQFLIAAASIMMIPAWVKGINLLILLALLVLAVCLVNYVVAWRQTQHVTASRRWRGPVFAQAPSSWEINIHNNAPRSSTGLAIRDAGPQHECAWFVQHIPAQGTCTLRANVILPYRGHYRFHPVMIASASPFGLARWTRAAGHAEEIVVLPALGRLRLERFRRWLQRITRGEHRLHRLARPSTIHQDDLHGLRPFRLGDNPRWIHWRTSARRNQRMVREFEEDTGQNLVLVFEPWQASPSADPSALEAAISLAATVVWEWSHFSSEYMMLAIAGPTPVVKGGFCSRDRALTMLRCLAEVVGTTTIETYPLIQAIAREPLVDAPIILVSPRSDSPLAGALTAAWNRPFALLTFESSLDFYEPPTLTRRVGVPMSKGSPCPA